MNKNIKNNIKISEADLQTLRRQIHNTVAFWLKDKPNLKEQKLEEMFLENKCPLKTELKYNLVINNYKKAK